MKKQYREIRFGDSLRTGLLVAVCFFGIICLLSGCGSEDRLLSELRAESDTALTGPENIGEAGGKSEDGRSADASESTQNAGEDMDREAAAEGGAAEKAGQETDGNTGKGIGTENGRADGQGSGQTAGDGDVAVSEKPETVYVHVCGAVKKPGVYEMPAGSRFYEAVDAAGGFAEDACQDYLNMAAPLADGSRLEIPTLQEIQERESAEYKNGNSGERKEKAEYSYYTAPEVPASGTGNGGTSETGIVNINTADISQLLTIPGIGQTRAEAVLAYRQENGNFQSIEDIMKVSGIKNGLFEKMKDYITVG